MIELLEKLYEVNYNYRVEKQLINDNLFLYDEKQFKLLKSQIIAIRNSLNQLEKI